MPSRLPIAPRRAVAAAALLVLLGTTGCEGTECGAPPLDAGRRACVAEATADLVEAAWPFAEAKGVELGAWRAQVLALADAGGPDDAFLSALARAVIVLHDGHTRLERPGTVAALPRVRLRRVGEAIVVAAAAPDTGLLPGDRILAVDGQPALERLADYETRVTASNAPGAETVALRVLLAGDPDLPAQVEVAARGVVEVPRRPWVDPRTPPEGRRIGRVGYLRLATFAYLDDVDAFDRALDGLGDVDGLVLDLRENGGGSTAVADLVMARLLAREAAPFRMVDRDGREVRRLELGPRGRTFDGPVALLTGPLTFSAANYFVQRLVREDRVTTVGGWTGGGAASPEATARLLPSVRLRVSSLVLVDAAGVDAEAGLAPDVPVVFGPEDLAAGRDAAWGDPETDEALARALEVVGGGA